MNPQQTAGIKEYFRQSSMMANKIKYVIVHLTPFLHRLYHFSTASVFHHKNHLYVGAYAFELLS